MSKPMEDIVYLEGTGWDSAWLQNKQYAFLVSCGEVKHYDKKTFNKRLDDFFRTRPDVDLITFPDTAFDETQIRGMAKLGFYPTQVGAHGLDSMLIWALPRSVWYTKQKRILDERLKRALAEFEREPVIIESKTSAE